MLRKHRFGIHLSFIYYLFFAMSAAAPLDVPQEAPPAPQQPNTAGAQRIQSMAAAPSPGPADAMAAEHEMAERMLGLAGA